MKLWVKRVTIGLVSLLLLAVAGLFLGRGVLLRLVADRKIGQLERRMDLQIAYKELRFVSFSEIELTGLSVVPPRRDTLLRLGRVRLQVDVLPLLQRKVSVRRVYTDGLDVAFVKKRGISNYDCLFRTRKEGKKNVQVEKHQLDYAQEVKRLADILFRLLPGNGEMHNTLISGRRDSLVTSFHLPLMTIVDNHFDADIQMVEGERKGAWNVSGFLDLDKISPNSSQYVKQVNAILRQAIAERTSDIHLEMFDERVSLRFRIDGSLYERTAPAKESVNAIISRIKILSKLSAFWKK